LAYLWLKIDIFQKFESRVYSVDCITGAFFTDLEKKGSVHFSTKALFQK